MAGWIVIIHQPEIAEEFGHLGMTPLTKHHSSDVTVRSLLVIQRYIHRIWIFMNIYIYTHSKCIYIYIYTYIHMHTYCIHRTQIWSRMHIFMDIYGDVVQNKSWQSWNILEKMGITWHHTLQHHHLNWVVLISEQPKGKNLGDTLGQGMWKIQFCASLWPWSMCTFPAMNLCVSVFFSTY